MLTTMNVDLERNDRDSAAGIASATYPPAQRPTLKWRLPDSPFPMWIFDRQSGAVLAANEAAFYAYGYTREGLLACRVSDLCPPRSPTDELQAIPLAGDLPLTESVRQRRRDGSTFMADITMIDTGDAANSAAMVLVQPRTYEPKAVGARSRRGGG